MLRLELLETNIEHKIETDIEKLFNTIKITGTDDEKRVIQLIEKGRYNDSKSFIDRFGYKLHLSELSTGCKGALCVLNKPDEKIDLMECGINALDVILSTCKNGNIIMRDRGVTIVDYSIDGKVDIVLDGYKFSSIERLNYYIFDERPFEPDFRKGGVACV